MPRRRVGKLKRRIIPYLLQANHVGERLFGRVPAPPPLIAKAAYVLDLSTGRPVMAKNAGWRLPPASLTKLATALVFAERSAGRWDEPVRILTEDGGRGSTMGLVPGEIVTRRDLLHGMMLPSGNDAAAVAERIIGSDCIGCLNELVARLGGTRTRFVNSHGHDAAGHRSTARDLALLAAAAFGNPAIAQAAGTRRYTVNDRDLDSTVLLLDEVGVTAGKTGSTPGAGACLALAYRSYVIVLLGSAVRFAGGRIVAESDRRYDDARSIMALL